LSKISTILNEKSKILGAYLEKERYKKAHMKETKISESEREREREREREVT
jgi:hypothetical protein